jgi:dTDP-4-dehydrorhamnose reductase
LGQNLAEGLAPEYEVHPVYHRNPPPCAGAGAVAADLTDPDQLDQVFRSVQPDVVVHTAAMSQPDECETSPDFAFHINTKAAEMVANECAGGGCRLVHISTDLVFDGRRGHYTEADPVGAPGVYAQSKIEAERRVLKAHESAVILRVALLYGPGWQAHPGSLEQVLASWRAGKPRTFYTDQFRTPLFAPQAAPLIRRIVENEDVRGILHAGGGERLSRYDFAVLLAERVHAPESLVLPGSMWDVKGAAPRGADCSLVSSYAEQVLGARLIGCAEGLDILARQGFLTPLRAGAS